YEIQKWWTGTNWFIEGDIKGCFDNIDHVTLLEIIQRDIQDGRLMQLIGDLLRAGYLEDWRDYRTLSGTPQGGIISPLLSNIYLTELDRFVENALIPAYTKGEERKRNTAYQKLSDRIKAARKRGNIDEMNHLKRERRKVSSVDPYDPDYRRLRYIRYAD